MARRQCLVEGHPARCARLPWFHPRIIVHVAQTLAGTIVARRGVLTISGNWRCHQRNSLTERSIGNEFDGCCRLVHHLSEQANRVFDAAVHARVIMGATEGKHPIPLQVVNVVEAFLDSDWVLAASSPGIVNQ